MPNPADVVSSQFMLPVDLVSWIHENFSGHDVAEVETVLLGATLHTGERPSNRQLRAAAIGSQGSLENLKYLVGLLRVDWRDVIVAGEYVIRRNQLVRVRNLDLPIPAGSSCRVS